VGPPPPPSHARPFLAPWGGEYYVLDRDDILDLESAATTALCVLGPITDWVEGAPVSSLAPEVSRTAWELFIATLRIPFVQEEFECLCQIPHSLQVAAGCFLPPSGGDATIEEVPQRPHARRHVRRGRR
jgi:hypothetical protein